MPEYIIQETIDFNQTRRVMTDDEVCERLPHELAFSATGKARGDGETPFTIGVQLVSKPLSDGSQRSIAEKRTIGIIGDDGEPFTVETDDNGHGEFTVVFATSGAYKFTTDGIIYSHGITIEAL